ncbi:GNAT family N-acetyltransferase [Streptomyces nanshensis]|uniref:Enhanced intracellular survival protein domain-containing protein n=1 Tax=Streptomyces nanshensis TaxID=518642 RepID=A0A1E7KYL0_9ACTN|nr:GNAT family N-acetyltransferase [Streptomyces nanshensis]OEV08995.1 hypothetical protein AN218_23900 [Streptomyces nanshensis]
MALEIRRLASPDELPTWFRALSAGFMHGPDVSEEETAARTPDIELARTQGAFDGSRCVATFRTFAQEMTVPGGAVLPSRESPDLTLDAGELGTLFLGDESAVRLAALGRVEAHREGAAEWADTLFRTPRRAWCPDVF